MLEVVLLVPWLWIHLLEVALAVGNGTVPCSAVRVNAGITLIVWGNVATGFSILYGTFHFPHTSQQ